jgi:outer membrane protein OmpA-like peptidoglycan-associated protein
MNLPTAPNRTNPLLIAAVALALGACASAPRHDDQLEVARVAVMTAHGDSRVVGEATTELAKADVALHSADALMDSGRPLSEVEHEAYLADRYARTAVEHGRLLSAQATIATLDSRRNAVLLAARENDTRRANQHAERMTEDAYSARRDALISAVDASNKGREAQEARADASNRGIEAQEARADASSKGREAQEARADATNKGLEAQVARADASNKGREAQEARVDASNKGLEAQVARADASDQGRQAQAARADASDQGRQAQAARADASDQGRQAQAARADAYASAQQASNADARSENLERQLSDLRAQPSDRGAVVTLGDMQFVSGRSELQEGSQRAIDQLTSYLSQHPKRTVRVEGFTDSLGSDSYNRALSERRAQSVSHALTNNGVPADRIQTEGYGNAYPVAHNDTASGRQQNRRVEVIISKGDERIAGRSQ